MVRDDDRATNLTVRVPRALADRLDGLAGAAGLSRSQFVRLVLGRLEQDDLPRGLIEHAADLRAARTAR